MCTHTSPERLKRDLPGHPGQRGDSCGGVLGRILQRFSTQQPSEEAVTLRNATEEPSPCPSPEALQKLSGMEKSIPDKAGESTWDGARALEVQAAIYARLDQVIAALPADDPHRQARLNVLANERRIVAVLMAQRDAKLWGWQRSLECMLKRWSEEDGDVRRRGAK